MRDWIHGTHVNQKASTFCQPAPSSQPLPRPKRGLSLQPLDLLVRKSGERGSKLVGCSWYRCLGSLVKQKVRGRFVISLNWVQFQTAPFYSNLQLYKPSRSMGGHFFLGLGISPFVAFQMRLQVGLPCDLWRWLWQGESAGGLVGSQDDFFNPGSPFFPFNPFQTTCYIPFLLVASKRSIDPGLCRRRGAWGTAWCCNFHRRAYMVSSLGPLFYLFCNTWLLSLFVWHLTSECYGVSMRISLKEL